MAEGLSAKAVSTDILYMRIDNSWHGSPLLVALIRKLRFLILIGKKYYPVASVACVTA